MSSKKQRARVGVQSVELASKLLRALADAPQAQSLKNLSARVSMTPSKVHRYLVSLVRAELVKQNSETGLYDVGPLALQLGLTALRRVNVVQLASAILPRLRDEIDETVMLSVWGNRGPTIVRLEESTQAVSMNARVGSVLPTSTTATGLVFLSYLPSSITSEIVKSSPDHAPGAGASKSDRQSERKPLNQIHQSGIARDVGAYLSGVSALAAPVFDSQGQLVAVLTALGRETSFNVDWDGPPAHILREAAALISRQLGFIGRTNAPHAPSRDVMDGA